MLTTNCISLTHRVKATPYRLVVARTRRPSSVVVTGFASTPSCSVSAPKMSSRSHSEPKRGAVEVVNHSVFVARRREHGLKVYEKTNFQRVSYSFFLDPPPIDVDKGEDTLSRSDDDSSSTLRSDSSFKAKMLLAVSATTTTIPA